MPTFRLGAAEILHSVWCGAGEHVMTAAGIEAALGAGAAVVVAKSFNETAAAAAQLDHADYVWLDDDHAVDARGTSLFCRSGLANVPTEAWIAEIGRLDRLAAIQGQYVAASIVMSDPRRAADLASACHTAGVRALELNVGAPHGRAVAGGAIRVETDPERLTRAVAGVRAAFPGLLWAKLSSFADNGDALTVAAKAGGADAACLSGRFLGMTPNLETLEPELGTMAAYGGRWALPITCRALALARQAVGPEFPLIGTNGAWTGRDAARMILAGASAVQMTSAVWRGGFGVLAEARDDLNAWVAGTGIERSALVGRAADALTAYTDQLRRPGRWRDLAPEESW